MPTHPAPSASMAPSRLDSDAIPHLRLVDLVKTFDGVTAINGVSLDIYSGEFFALLGPSGCGKSTLLRMLAGFETPDSGQILLDGQDLAGVAPYERPVNMMFQSYALFPHMNVEKNIAFGLEQEKMPKPKIARRVEEVINLVQLGKFAKRKPHQLSGGQRQRVALARALAKKPKLLLLDEPLGALDKKLREETQFELMDIQDSLGLTFVIVTHDQEEAMTVSCRLAVMDQGGLAQVGPPAEVYENPNSRYVAGFIGDVNLIEGAVSDPENGIIKAPLTNAPVHCGRAMTCDKGAAVTVALRPEKLLIEKLSGAETPSENYVDGKVQDIAYLGDMSIYNVRLPSGDLIKVARTNRIRAVTQTITWEDQVRLSWAPEAAIPLLN